MKEEEVTVTVETPVEKVPAAKKRKVQTPENVAKVKELREQGKKCKEIAVAMELKYSDVYFMIKRIEKQG